MKIHVRGRQVQVDDRVRAHVERRLQSSLDRFADRVQRVTVYLIDVNGPRGGEDKVCRIDARLRPVGDLFIAEADAELFAAVDRAADRLGDALARALRRRRDLARDAGPAGRGKEWSPPASDAA